MSEIKIIREPSVFLIGRQSIDHGELNRFLTDNECESWGTDTVVGAEKLVETAGRLCYMSFAKPRPGGNGAYVGHIKEVRHGSVFEHAVFNFIITGVSRSFTHELVRHRAGWGYSQLSQRFVDESDCKFVVPPALAEEVAKARDYIAKAVGRSGATALSVSMDMRNRHPMDRATEAGMVWLTAMEQARDSYSFLSDYVSAKSVGISDPTTRRKQAREAARSVLPNATETKIFVTANARALRHFVEMRADAAADAEMRRVALAMLNILRTEAANLFGDYDESGKTPFSKV